MSDHQFIITLEPTPGDTREPRIRLKQLLKLALRGCGLRAVDVREHHVAEVDANELGAKPRRAEGEANDVVR